MRVKAKNLIFISRILPNGIGLEEVPKTLFENSLFLEEKLKLTCLSISEKTFIASGFNSYVVKLKKKL